MNLIRCENGHFYDQNRYTSCPHCAGGAGRNSDLTVPVARNAGNEEMTAAVTSPLVSEVVAPQTSPLQSAVLRASGGDEAKKLEDDERTVSFYKRTIGLEPVTGWLVCVRGEHFGEDFRLKTGRNFIGRSTGMDVAIIKDSAVSREKHAAVVYEPKGNSFLIMPGDSKELCYLNDSVVLTPAELKSNDVLTLGNTDLMFIPCCSQGFIWENVIKEEDS